MLNPQIQEYTFPDGKVKYYMVNEQEILRALYDDADSFIGQHPSAPRSVWIVSKELSKQYNIISTTFERLRVMGLVSSVVSHTEAALRWELTEEGERCATITNDDYAAPEDDQIFPTIKINPNMKNEWKDKIKKIAMLSTREDGSELSISFDNADSRDSFLNDIGWGHKNILRSMHLAKR